MEPRSGKGTFSRLVPGSSIFIPGCSLENWTADFSSTSTAAGAFSPSIAPNNGSGAWREANDIGYLLAATQRATQGATVHFLKFSARLC